MDESNILLKVLEWAWLGVIGVLGWLIKKVYSVEKDCSGDDAKSKTDIAVLDNSQQSLRDEFNREMKRNKDDHVMILDKLDAHNTRVMTRLDSLVRIAKNGNK